MNKLAQLGKALLAESGKPYNAFNGFLGPFRVDHAYVNDARGNTVVNCEGNQATAKVICALLNKTYPPKAK
jgi:hypothetical protein